ncbi:MAG: hypothetical protein M0T82_06315 [Desulfobacteraceae bacterium]|nr:hypothetical protein [Desulfobacteraceae bacterium]
MTQTISPIEPGQEWTVESFTPKDAPGVTQLFLGIYGAGYPVRIYVEPDLLIEENRSGRVISSVAKTAKGDIVGHNALFNSAPCKNVFETGAGLVHADYRGGHGIFSQMTVHGLTKGRERPDVEQVFGEPVCNHPFSQKLGHNQGFITRAIEVNLMPAAAYAKEAGATGRVTTLMNFKTLKPAPCTVYIPKVYETLFPVFYEDLDDERQFALSAQPLSSQRSTGLDTQVFNFAQVARVAVKDLGRDFHGVMQAEEERLLQLGIRVIQAWLSSGDPCVGEAVDCLRSSGYFFGGVLPRWFDSDGILMEKILDIPVWEEINLYLERAQTLMALIRKDWEEVLDLNPKSQWRTGQ